MCIRDSGKGMDIAQVESFDIPDSTGWMYAGLTEFLGFRPYSDEGSVMGLACYGAYDPEIHAVFDRIAPLSPDGAYRVDPVSYTHLRAHEPVLDLVCRLLLDKTHIHL